MSTRWHLNFIDSNNRQFYIKGGGITIGIFDFFRRKNQRQQLSISSKSNQEWEVTLAEDPFADKLQQALGYKEDGKEKEAELLLREVVAEKSEHVRAWYLLAELFMEIDEVGRALYCYEQVVHYQPTNSQAQHQVERLAGLVRRRPDYLWEYNKERGLI